MNAETQTANRHLHPLESLAISISFWLTLLLASLLFALLTLSPRWVEITHLQSLSRSNQEQLSQTNQEIHHLNRVATAMVEEPEFVSRLAKKEFSLAAQGSVQIQVEKNLNYDARVPTLMQTTKQFENAWYNDLLRQFSVHSRLRTPCRWGAAGLFLVAFLFLNESFFTGNIGRFILNLLAGFFRRYHIQPSKID